jgi:uncharacterized protein YkwD
MVKKNIYRATFWGKWLLLVLVFLASQPATSAETYRTFALRLSRSESEGMRFRPDLESYLLGAANTYRRKKGVHHLGRNERNLVLARAHAMDMALNGFVGHRSSNGRDFESRVRALRPGEMFLPVMGENAARVSSGGPATAAKAAKLMQQWIGSRSHRHSLGSRSFVSVATGVVQRGDKLYAVQIFSGPEVKTNVRQSGADAPGPY